MTTTIIMTMAGAGSRFRDAGYDQPKFAIEVHGRPLLYWSLSSLRRFASAGARIIFVARAADDPVASIAAICAEVGFANWSVVTVAAPTDGQATTVLAAEPAICEPENRLLIYNVDTLVWPSALDPAEFSADGWLPCFPARGDAWSFVRADKNGRAREVREKRRISSDATIGLYGFADWPTYRAAYAQTYSRAAPREAGESYVAPMYNAMIAGGADVRIARLPLDAVVPLGTPADLMAFAARGAVEPSATVERSAA